MSDIQILLVQLLCTKISQLAITIVVLSTGIIIIYKYKQRSYLNTGGLISICTNTYHI